MNDDLRGTTRHAAGALLRLGHRQIGYFLRRSHSAGEQDEEEGFLSAFAPGAEAQGSLIRHTGTVATIHSRLARLFADRAAAPTALLVSHAEDTLVILNWGLARGMQLPRDLSLISYQWESYLERLSPKPAWYYSDPTVHARKLARLLLRASSRQPLLRPILPTFHKNDTLARPALR